MYLLVAILFNRLFFSEHYYNIGYRNRIIGDGIFIANMITIFYLLTRIKWVKTKHNKPANYKTIYAN